MKTFGDIDIGEGSEIHNMTVASGTSFPANPNDGELFFLDGSGEDDGLHIFHGEWKSMINIKSFTNKLNDALVPNTIQISSSAQMNINTSARVAIPWNIEIIRDTETYEVDPTDNSKIRFKTDGGEYEVSYKINHILNGKKHKNIETFADLSGNEMAYTRSYTYSRDDTNSYGSNTATFTLKAGAGDFLTIYAKKRGGSGTVNLIGSESSLSIKRIK